MNVAQAQALCVLCYCNKEAVTVHKQQRTTNFLTTPPKKTQYSFMHIIHCSLTLLISPTSLVSHIQHITTWPQLVGQHLSDRELRGRSVHQKNLCFVSDVNVPHWIINTSRRLNLWGRIAANWTAKLLPVLSFGSCPINMETSIWVLKCAQCSWICQ